VIAKQSVNGISKVITNGGLSNGTSGHTNGVNGHSNGVLNGTQNGDISNGVNGASNGVNATTNNTTNGSHLDDVSANAPPQVFILSAFSEKSLLGAAENLKSWVSEYQPDRQTLKNLSYTLAVHRSLLPWRASFIASTAEELCSELKQIDSLKTRAVATVPVAFVFTGQGAQWNAMGRELISNSKVFELSITRSERLLHSFGCAWSLVEELSKDEKDTRLGEAELSQPATTAIQLALVDLYKSLGIKPTRVVGHSSGEIGAAYAAGALSHEAAIEV